MEMTKKQMLIFGGSAIGGLLIIGAIIAIVIIVMKNKGEKFEMIRDGKVLKQETTQDSKGDLYQKTTLGDKVLENKKLGENNVVTIAEQLKEYIPNQTFQQYKQEQDTMNKIGGNVLDQINIPSTKQKDEIQISPMDETADIMVQQQVQKETFEAEPDEYDYSQQMSSLFDQTNNLLIQQNDNLANNPTQQLTFQDRQIKTYIQMPSQDINQIEQLNRNNTAQQSFNHLMNASSRMGMMLAPAPISGQQQGGVAQRVIINSGQSLKVPQSLQLQQFQDFNAQGFFRNMIGEKALQALESKQISPISDKDVKILQKVIKEKTPITERPIIDDKQRTVITDESLQQQKNGTLQLSTSEIPLDAVTDAMDSVVKQQVSNAPQVQEQFGRYTPDKRQAIAELMTVYFVIALQGYQDKNVPLQQVAELFPSICKFYGSKCTPSNITQLDNKNRSFLQKSAKGIPDIQTIKNFIQQKYGKEEVVTKINVPQSGETQTQAVSVDENKKTEKYVKTIKLSKYMKKK